VNILESISIMDHEKITLTANPDEKLLQKIGTDKNWNV
jgi:hypothetical protein